MVKDLVTKSEHYIALIMSKILHVNRKVLSVPEIVSPNIVLYHLSPKEK